MFERIYIEISNICNLKCTFCPEVVREQKVISIEDFRRFATQAKPLTKQVCLHLMGEPLGHPQFKQIMDICDELGLRVFLTTNGTLIKRHIDHLLAWKSLDQINFSVHSYFANSKLRTLEQYLNPILDFCDQALENKADFYINLRLWNLAETSAQNNQNGLVIDLIEQKFNLKIDRSVDVLKTKSKKIKDKVYIHYDTEFEWPTLKREVLSEKGTCHGLRKQLAIHANGDVVPCCLDKEAVLKLGSLSGSGATDQARSLQQIITSPLAREIKSGFERGVLNQELCQKCQYAERFR